MVNDDIEYVNNKLILNIALQINKELYEENKITYLVFKNTEELLLKEMNY